MIKYYVNKNRIFKNISDEYYENDPNCKWIKVESDTKLCDICDIDWDNRYKINYYCKITSQIEGIHLLGNKRQQYKLMELNYREYGQGIPLIIVHGLFGSSDNWKTQAKKFSEYFRVIVVDVRNHGRSPWSDEFSYQIIADDLISLIENLNIDKCYILGHSMGGKAVMHLAQKDASKILGLIVVDMGIKKYEPHHQHILKAIHSIPLESIGKRSEADVYLKKEIDEMGVRQFLLKNLYWKEKGQLSWRMNVKVLENEMDEILSEMPDGDVLLPTLFIRGALSRYILDEDINDIENQFPDSEVKTIPNAGHWVHAESPDDFVDMVLAFCLR